MPLAQLPQYLAYQHHYLDFIVLPSLNQDKPLSCSNHFARPTSQQTQRPPCASSLVDSLTALQIYSRSPTHSGHRDCIGAGGEHHNSVGRTWLHHPRGRDTYKRRPLRHFSRAYTSSLDAETLCGHAAMSATAETELLRDAVVKRLVEQLSRLQA